MIFAVRDRYERELACLQRFISPGMVVVDGGANLGIYTVAAASLVGATGLVLSFEPGDEAFSVLQKNIGINHFRNVRAYRAALFHKNGLAPLYHFNQGSNSFSLGLPKDLKCESEEVTTRTLGSVLEEQGIQRIGVIKLDVEGAEELVLQGAAEIIRDSHPKIIFEMNPKAARRLELSETGVWRLLNSWGYKFYSLTKSYELHPLTEPPGEGNLIAIWGS